MRFGTTDVGHSEQLRVVKTLRRVARWFSAGMCVGLIGLWIISYHQHPWYDGRQAGRNIRVGAFDGWFWVFNTESPYMGSIIAVSSPGKPSEFPRGRAVDFPGIYFRHFWWPDQTVWSLGVSFLYPALFAVIALTCTSMQRHRREKTAAGANRT